MPFLTMTYCETCGGLYSGKRCQRCAATRWLLYDFDADELVTTTVYHTYAEASEDARDVENVQILKVEV